MIEKKVFISIHAAREGGDTVTSCSTPSYDISIHAAREGGDNTEPRRQAVKPISIHAAREGGDPLWVYNKGMKREDFNPRRP